MWFNSGIDAKNLLGKTKLKLQLIKQSIQIDIFH